MRTRHVLKALLPAAPRLIAVLLVLLIVSVIGMGTVGAIGRPELNRALLATVRLAVPVEAEEDTYSTGSGTILTENGYILTNFHVMGDVDKEELYNEDGIAFVAVNPTNLRGEPVWKYRAHLVKGDTTLDLAVIKIDGLLDDEKEPLPEKLGLTTVPIGDSEAVMIGDEINIIGFPSIARGSVTFTDGKVAGFLDDDKDGVIDWFKTDAEIARGNSGGLAANADGEIIGVPTIVVADTETASNIGLVRPIDRALALFRAALSQEDTTERQRGLPSLRKGKATGPQVENVRFATAVDRKGLPIEPASRFDLTTKTVYAVFDYVNFKDGADFEYTWYQDGFEILSDSLQWEDGPQGSFWLNIHSKKPFPEGFYELEILLDGERLYRGGFVVGEAQPETTPENGSFGPITFATGVTEN
ncbi:MAG: serine protease, partial [Chloroflexi bacterium]